MYSNKFKFLIVLVTLTLLVLFYYADELKHSKVVILLSNSNQNTTHSKLAELDPQSSVQNDTLDPERGGYTQENGTEMSFVKKVNQEYESNYQTVEHMITDRMKRIDDHCRAHRSNYYLYNVYNFPELNLLWVPSFKAGSSTWRDFLIQTVKDQSVEKRFFNLKLLEERQLGENDYLRLVRGSKPRELIPTLQSKINNRTVSFMQVRHPIDRLISLHLSTAVLHSDIGSMKVWGMQAIEEGRWVPAHKAAQFKKELHTWIQQRDRIGELSPHSDDNPYFDPPHPTFKELVAYIIKRRYKDGKTYDGHWYPASEWGDVCQNNLTYIIKLENNPMETVFILNKVNLTDNEDFFLHKHNPSDDSKTVKVVADEDNRVKDFKRSDPSKYEPWIKELSKEQKKTLKDIYSEDFKLFNYDNSMLN